MKLDDVERVAELRRQRQLTMSLRTAARCGTIGDFNVWNEGDRLNVFAIISAEPLRAAMICACNDGLNRIDTELRQLGVSVGRDEKHTEPTADDWRRTAEMYANAWHRELGYSLLPKAHFIDALVLTTRQIVERANKATAA